MEMARSETSTRATETREGAASCYRGSGEHQGAGELHVYPPWSKKGYGKGKSTGKLREGHKVADEAVMKLQRSNNKKRKKAIAEMCTNPPAPTLGTLAVDKDKQPPMSKKKRLSTPSIRANGKVTSPTRSASRRCCICCQCKKRGSDVLLPADASIALPSLRSGPMLARAKPAKPVMPLFRLRSTCTKPEAGQLKLNIDGSCKGKSRSQGGAEKHQGTGELHMEPRRFKKRNGNGQSAGELREAHQVADEVVMEPPRSKNKKRKKATAEMRANPPAPTFGTLAVDKAPLSKKKRLNRNLHGLSKPPAPNLYPKKPKVMSSASRKQRGSVNMSRKPKAVRLKLNFDGSSKHDESRSASIGAFGGVFRDHKGKFVLGYAGRIDKATSSVAELVALRRGLELALENRWRGISIEGDFKTAIDAIARRVRVRAKKDMMQFRAITKMLPRLGKVTVTHVRREGNKVADCFAKLGHKGKAAAQRVWRDIPQDEVLVHFKQDVKSKAKKEKK